MTLGQIEKVLNSHDNWTTDTIIKRLCEKEPIGEGLYRDVYAFRENRNYVIKIERDMMTGTFCNVTEFRNWCNFKFTPYVKWLAPCVFISVRGNVLIQYRAKPVEKKDLPKKLPPFFTDKKAENWGRIGNRIVCVDYAYILPDQGKMKRVIWK